MGYYTTFTGALTFSRPLTFAEIAAVPDQDCFGLARQTERRQTPEGYLDVITATGIESTNEDEMKAYDALDELRTLVRALPGDVTIAGEIRGEGEESGDVRRYVFHRGQVVELKPRLVWPDGYSEDPR